MNLQENLYLETKKNDCCHIVNEERTSDPRENLKRESYYWKTLEYPAARVWINEPCVVLGRFLKAEEEVFTSKAAESQIPILWRPSGGGAVYHDLGNINYSLYLTGEGLPFNAEERLKLLSFPVSDLLDYLGVPWEWIPPNNIYVLGKKISGSAQARSRGRILHHGTLLVDCDLDTMRRLLKTGGRSQVAKVMNLKELVPGIKVEEVETLLKEAFKNYRHRNHEPKHRIIPYITK